MNHYLRTAGRFLQYSFFVSVLILAAAPARAASVSFFLDQSNELPDGVNYLSVSLMDNDTGGMDGFGRFDFRLQGKGWARTDELSFKVSGVSLGNFDPLFFAAHVAGLEWCNIGDERRRLCSGKDCLTSAYFTGSLSTTPVPIPAAVWLFGSSLIGLVAVARRKA
jgi:hypothetical protein